MDYLGLEKKYAEGKGGGGRKKKNTAQRAKTRHPKNSVSCLQIRSAIGM